MAPIVATTEIDRPAREVFDYVTDPTHFCEWQNGVVDGKMDTLGPPSVGDHCRTTEGSVSRNDHRPRRSPMSTLHTRGVCGASMARSAQLLEEPLTWLARQGSNESSTAQPTSTWSSCNAARWMVASRRRAQPRRIDILVLLAESGCLVGRRVPEEVSVISEGQSFLVPEAKWRQVQLPQHTVDSTAHQK